MRELMALLILMSYLLSFLRISFIRRTFELSKLDANAHMARWCSFRFFSNLFVLTVFFAACSEDSPDEGKILPPEKMVVLAKDIHLLEAKISRLKLKGDSSGKVYRHFEKKIFDKHQTDSATYYRSYKSYADRPLEFYKIYERVVDSLMAYKNKEQLGEDEKEGGEEEKEDQDSSNEDDKKQSKNDSTEKKNEKRLSRKQLEKRDSLRSRKMQSLRK